MSSRRLLRWTFSSAVGMISRCPVSVPWSDSNVEGEHRARIDLVSRASSEVSAHNAGTSPGYRGGIKGHYLGNKGAPERKSARVCAKACFSSIVARYNSPQSCCPESRCQVHFSSSLHLYILTIPSLAVSRSSSSSPFSGPFSSSVCSRPLPGISAVECHGISS